jgi:hypothetical protein
MAKKIPMEKIIWLAIVIFNFLALITIFQFNTFIETMIWADVWIIAIFKAEKVLKGYISLRISSLSNKKK